MAIEKQTQIEDFFEKRKADKQLAADGDAQRALEAEQTVEDKSSDVFSFEDLALAVPRGVEGFARSAVGVANIIPGVDIDTSGSFLGESETIVGSTVEGITQFTLGFLPGLGIAGRLGKIGAIAKVGAKVAESGRFGALVAAGTKGAVAGGVGDFVAFEANEERLSNLIQSVPGLRNPVSEFLAAEEDDSEAVGRLKNTLEGLGVGALLGGLVGGLKGMKAQRLRKLDDSAASIQKSIDDIVDPVDIDSGMDASYDMRSSSDTFGTPVDPEAARASEAARKAAGPTLDEPGKLSDGKFLSETPEGSEEIMRQLGVEPEKASENAEELLARRNRRIGEGDDPLVNPRTMETADQAAQRLGKASMNLEQAAVERGVGWMIRAFEDQVGAASKNLPVIPTAETAEKAARSLADVAGTSPEETLDQVLRMVREAPAQAQAAQNQMLSLTAIYEQTGFRMKTLLDEFAGGDESAQDAIMVVSKIMDELGPTVRELHGQAGRSLQVLAADRSAFGHLTQSAEDLTNFITKAGGDKKQLNDLFAQMRTAYGEGGIDGTAAMMNLQRATLGSKTLAVTTEFFINSLLGAAKTTVVNTLTPLMNGLYLPLENMIGGAARFNGTMIKRSLFELTGLSSTVKESMRYAWKATKGGAILDPAGAFRDDALKNVGAIRGETFGLKAGTTMSGAADWFGKAVRIPSALMRGADEFGGQMLARASIMADAQIDGMAKGMTASQAASHAHDTLNQTIKEGVLQTKENVKQAGILDAEKMGITGPAEVQAHVKVYVNKNFKPELSPSMERGLSRAQEGKLTTPLDPESLTGAGQTLLNSHPVLRLVVPFYKTPVNIAKFVGQRTDAISAVRLMAGHKFDALTPGLEQSRMRLVRDMMSDDPMKKAEATGRMVTGMGLLGAGLEFAAGGEITGRGPADPELRQSMVDAGWQPYSFKTKDGFVSYLKMDPFATFLGLTADVFDTMRLNEMDDQEHHSLINAGLVSLANNLTQRSFLQGISEVVDAMSDPERNMSTLVEQYAGSIVPSSLAQFTTIAGDEVAHDTNSILERIVSRTPFLSKDAPPARTVLGEKVRNTTATTGDAITNFGAMFSPISYREVSDDPIRKEFFNLQHGFSPPKAAKLGLDLRDFKVGNQSAHDRWQELHGKVKINGRSLKQELRRLISSRDYQRMDPRSSASQKSPRVNMIQSVISRFRQEAFEDTLKQYPELRLELSRREKKRTSMRQGIRSGRANGISTVIGNLNG